MSCERAPLLVDPDDVDEAHVATCADCTTQRAAMRRIAAAMRDVGSTRRAPDHLARAFAAIDRPPRRSWLPIAGAVVALAAAAVLVVWLRRPEPAPFGIDIVAGGSAIRGRAHLGDQLRVHVPRGVARIYRNDRELVRECTRACEVTLDAIARYQVLWLDGTPPAATGSVDGDIAAAGGKHELREVEVR